MIFDGSGFGLFILILFKLWHLGREYYDVRKRRRNDNEDVWLGGKYRWR